MYKNSVSPSQKTYCISITKTSLLILFTEIITVYGETQSRDIVDSVESRLRAGGSGVRIAAEARGFSLFQNVQPSCGAHTTFYSMCNGGSIPGDKATDA
jgi:hypothetical protein